MKAPARPPSPTTSSRRPSAGRHRGVYRCGAAHGPDVREGAGVDLDSLLISQPQTGEQAMDICDILVRSGGLDIFVVDSVAALVPKAELEGEMADSHMGLQARLMSKALRKVAYSIRQSNTVGIFLNQIREKIGVMFGNPEATPGGRALKFWSSVRIEMRRIETLKKGTELVGNRTACEGDQEQRGGALPPGRVRHYVRPRHFPRAIWWTRAPSTASSPSPAPSTPMATRSWARGRNNARSFLEENLALMDEIEALIREPRAEFRPEP